VKKENTTFAALLYLRFFFCVDVELFCVGSRYGEAVPIIQRRGGL